MKIRLVEASDYYKGHLALYQQLTSLNPDTISYEDYVSFITEPDRCIFVIENSDNQIVATITSYIEKKLIHNFGKVGHIEDVVVDSRYRSQGMGKMLIEHAHTILMASDCYKTILNCSDDKVGFYSKCGFQRTGNCMSYYK